MLVSFAIGQPSVCHRAPLHSNSAVAAGVTARGDVHAQVGRSSRGSRPLAGARKKTIIADSTGTALQDVAAAAAVYRRALEHGEGTRFSFNA